MIPVAGTDALPIRWMPNDTSAVAPQRIILLEQDLMRAIRIIARRHLHLNWPFGGSRFSSKKNRNQHLRMSSDLPRFFLLSHSHTFKLPAWCTCFVGMWKLKSAEGYLPWLASSENPNHTRLFITLQTCCLGKPMLGSTKSYYCWTFRWCHEKSD